MKKLLIPMCLVLFLTGCTKNYKTVEEFEAEMKKIKSANNSYTIETKLSTFEGNAYLRTMHKNGKWKSELSMNDGLRYIETTLYDGNEILKYKADSKIAVTIPNFDLKGNLNNLINPAGSLYEWEKDLLSFDENETKKSEFIKQNENKNNFPCRLIKYEYKSGATKEVCVNDKYGVAVYSKYTISDPNGKQDITSELNVVKISTDEINDTEFQLPKDVKKMNFQQLMNELSASLKQMNTSLSEFNTSLK